MNNRIENQAELFRVFANATRLRILQTMVHGELSVSRIAEQIGISVQNTSHHLRFMKDKGLLKSRRVGQKIRYRIANLDLVSDLLSTASREHPKSEFG